MASTRTRNPHNLREDLHRDLNLIIVAVTFGMAYMTIYNGPPLNAFIRSLGGGDFVFAVIMAMPVFTGLLQLVASIVVQRAGRRKAIFVTAGVIQRLILIPIALVPLFLPEKFQGLRILIVLLLIGVNAGAQAFMSIIFTSWMGALVPSDIRGRYFSRRALISTITSLVVAPLSGLFLDRVPGANGYAVLFCIVAVLGVVDILCFLFVTDPPMPPVLSQKPVHMHLLQPLKNKNYRRFIVFATAFQFSLNLSASFFTPFMLETLKMDMLAITLLTQTTMSLFTILFVGRLGRLMDRFGTKTVMGFSLWVVIFLPLLWTVTTSTLHIVPILIVQILAGVLWPALDLGLMNLSIWLAPEDDRPSHLASYAFIVALFGILPGQLIGGALMEGGGAWLRANPIPWFFGRGMVAFDLLLLLTFLGRLLAVVFLFPKIEDPDSSGTPLDVAKAFFTRPSQWRRSLKS